MGKNAEEEKSPHDPTQEPEKAETGSEEKKQEESPDAKEKA